MVFGSQWTLWLDTVVLAFFLFRACESRKMCVDTWLDQYPLFEMYIRETFICLDSVTRSFLDAARNLLRRFFFGFKKKINLFCGGSEYIHRSCTLQSIFWQFGRDCGRVENDSLRSYLQGLDSVSLGVMALFSCTSVPRLSCCRVCRALSLTFRSCFPCSWRITLGSL